MKHYACRNTAQYLPTKRRDWSFDPVAAAAQQRRNTARRWRTRRAIDLALGTALFIAATGERPKTRPVIPARHVTVVSISDLL